VFVERDTALLGEASRESYGWLLGEHDAHAVLHLPNDTFYATEAKIKLLAFGRFAANEARPTNKFP
jgi:hypothetical protein